MFRKFNLQKSKNLKTIQKHFQLNHKMRLNQSSNLSPSDPLAIKSQPINIAENFKYIGCYVGSKERYVKVRIALA